MPTDPQTTVPGVLAMLAKLPPACFVRRPTSRGRETRRIDRGMPGYTIIETDIPVDALNAALPVPPTPAQIETMQAGSMFGWHVPGADLDVVRERMAHGRAALDPAAPPWVVLDVHGVMGSGLPVIARATRREAIEAARRHVERTFKRDGRTELLRALDEGADEDGCSIFAQSGDERVFVMPCQVTDTQDAR